MAKQSPFVAQLIADLFVSIEQDDPLGTLEATHALAERLGSNAATAIAHALLADHRLADAQIALAPQAETTFQLVSCA